MESKREYLISFIFVIDIPKMDSHLYSNYKNYWYKFMKSFWRTMFSRKYFMSSQPEMRRICSEASNDVTIKKLHPLLESKNDDNIELLILCSPFFDHAPIELKSAILVGVGLHAEELEKFFENNR